MYYSFTIVPSPFHSNRPDPLLYVLERDALD